MLNTISLSLNLDNLRHNYALAKALAPAAKVFAVVKSDGYGHGLLNIGRALRQADGFATIQLDDALALRGAGLRQPILIMEGINDAREIAEVCAHRLTLVLRSPDQLEMLSACRTAAPVAVWVKVKSAINRFGFTPGEALKVVRALQALPQAKVAGLMMHFPSADNLDCDLDSQWATFRGLQAATGLPFSVANSAAMLRDARTHGSMVRLGSSLYGNNPFVGGKGADTVAGLRPVMRLAARIVDTARVAAGEAVGYGGTFIAERPMRIGIVGCGYGDGYPSSAATGTPVLVNGARTRIIGKVAMNVMFIDLEPLPAAQVGDWVTLWGDERLGIGEVAAHAGLGPEAIQCGLAKKHRVHLIEEIQACGT